MGCYIEVPSPKDKAQQLVDLHGAAILTKQPRFEEIPTGKALICVVLNAAFEAAALVYDRDEFIDFTLPEDPRPRTWLLMEQSVAHELAGYSGEKP